jgi:hypothetical protein
MRLVTISDSENIELIGYDPTKVQLGVVFKSDLDTVYLYKSVTAYMFLEMLNAESIGGWFAHHIKRQPKVYPFTKSAREKSDLKK